MISSQYTFQDYQKASKLKLQSKVHAVFREEKMPHRKPGRKTILHINI